VPEPLGVMGPYGVGAGCYKLMSKGS
jgi:hypothetical protein